MGSIYAAIDSPVQVIETIYFVITPACRLFYGDAIAFILMATVVEMLPGLVLATVVWGRAYECSYGTTGVHMCFIS